MLNPVVLLHVRKDILTELMDWAQVLLYDRDIRWIVTSVSNPERSAQSLTYLLWP